jgi:DNA-binding transcriptional LysR family regulator
VLQLNDEMIDVLRGSTLSGVVRIGFAQGFTANILPLVIERFGGLYPLVMLEVTVVSGQVLIESAPPLTRHYMAYFCSGAHNTQRPTDVEGLALE